ncbi:nitrile hydratase accessory protein [Marinibaculum pumilum]|uniref:Nitrile hydratase accessory protein n=1 Tax=Marinibaculum pumilum TaxID=1766165 RepID=A0ABV7KWG1_9PROT
MTEADSLALAIAAARAGGGASHDLDAGPVFAAPWQARAFATVVALHEAGALDWSDWAARLSAAISAAQAAGDPDLGDSYYDHWAVALEGLLADAGLVAPSEHAADTAALLHHRAEHRHGLPPVPGHDGHRHGEHRHD